MTVQELQYLLSSFPPSATVVFFSETYPMPISSVTPLSESNGIITTVAIE